MDLLLPLFQTSLIKVAAPITVLVGIVFFAWRVKSIYTVLERFWRLIVGRVEVSDPLLKGFIQETRDVEKFRFMFRIDVANVKEIHKVINWSRYYAIRITKAQVARRWINVQSENLFVDPPARYFGSRLSGAIIFLFCVSASVGLFSIPSAVLQMKQSKIWLLADVDAISRFGGGWRITLEDCNRGSGEVERITGFKPDEGKAVCDAFKTGELKKVANESRRQQRGLAAGVGASSFYFLVVFAYGLFAYNAALDIKNAIDRKVKSKDQRLAEGSG